MDIWRGLDGDFTHFHKAVIQDCTASTAKYFHRGACSTLLGRLLWFLSCHRRYLFGAAGAGAGGLCTGADLAGAEDVLPSTDRLRAPAREAYTDSVIDVTIKMIAAQVVALVSTVAAVRVPKAV